MIRESWSLDEISIPWEIEVSVRKKIVGSSWKMHINSFDEASTLAQGIAERLGSEEEVDLFHPTRARWSMTNVFSGCQHCLVPYCSGRAHAGRFLSKAVDLHVELNRERKRHANERLMFGWRLLAGLGLCAYGLTPIVCIGETSEDIERDRSRWPCIHSYEGRPELFACFSWADYFGVWVSLGDWSAKAPARSILLRRIKWFANWWRLILMKTCLTRSA